MKTSNRRKMGWLVLPAGLVILCLMLVIQLQGDRRRNARYVLEKKAMRSEKHHSYFAKRQRFSATGTADSRGLCVPNRGLQA